MGAEPENIQQLLDKVLQAAGDLDRVSINMIVETVGNRSFGPLLLVAGLILASPLSGIPGVPTTFGMLVLVVSLQMLLRRHRFWLPDWVLQRSVSRRRLVTALKFLRPPARFIDNGLRNRLPFFVSGGGQVVIALVCVFISAGTPLMELVPFSATTAGVAIAVFGLAIVAHDGFVALVAFLLTGMIFGLIVSSF